MPQGVGYPTLEEDMLAQTAPPQLPGATGPVAGANMDGAPQTVDNLRDQLSPMISNEMEDFMVEFLAVADDLGVLDGAFGEESVEDQADLQDATADPMQFLSEQQLISLVTKFNAIPEPQRTELESILRAELPPQIVSRLDAVFRFVKQRAGGQQ